MAQVDLGLRLYLEDAASSGLLSFQSILMGISGITFTAAGQFAGLNNEVNSLTSTIAREQSQLDSYGASWATLLTQVDATEQKLAQVQQAGPIFSPSEDARMQQYAADMQALQTKAADLRDEQTQLQSIMGQPLYTTAQAARMQSMEADMQALQTDSLFLTQDWQMALTQLGQPLYTPAQQMRMNQYQGDLQQASQDAQDLYNREQTLLDLLANTPPLTPMWQAYDAELQKVNASYANVQDSIVTTQNKIQTLTNQGIQQQSDAFDKASAAVANNAQAQQDLQAKMTLLNQQGIEAQVRALDTNEQALLSNAAAQDALNLKVQALTDTGYARQNTQIAQLQTSLDSQNAKLEQTATQWENTSAAIDQNTQKLSEAGQMLETLGPGLAILAGSGADLFAFAGGLKAVDDAAAGLQDAMAKVSIAVQGTDQNLQGMSDYLIQLANHSIYSTTQLADGFQLLGERGYTASQIIQGNMGAALTTLSEAIGANGSSGIVGAAGLLSSAMEIWHAQFTDSAHYADLLTYAFYNGIPSVDQLRSALEAVGGQAQLLKIPLDEMVVSLDGLARAGMSGSQAGAALNYYLTALSTPLPKAQAELAQLGLLVVNNVTPAFQNFADKLNAASAAAGTTAPKFDGSVKSLDDMFLAAQKLGLVSLDASFYQWGISMGILNNKMYDSKGNFIGLEASLQKLNDALVNMNPEEKAAALSQLFNVKSGTGAKDLLNNLQDIINKIDALKKSHDAQGTAAKDAATITDTYNAKLKELGTTMSDLGAHIGLPIVTALGNIASALNTFVSSLSTGNPQLYQFMGMFLIIGTALSVVGVIVGIVVLAFVFFGEALVPVLITAGIIAAAIPLLSAALAGLGMSGGGVAKVLGTIGSVLQMVGQTIVGYLLPAIQPAIAFFVQGIQNAFKNLSSQVIPAWNDMVASIRQAMPVLIPIGQFFLALGLIILWLVGAVLAGALNALVVWFGTVVTGLMLIFTGLFRVVSGVVQFIMGALTVLHGVFTGNGKEIQAGLQTAWKGIIQIFQGGLQAIFGVVLVGFSGIIGIVFGFGSGVINFFVHLYNVLVGHSIIPDLLKSMLNFFTQFLSLILGLVWAFVTGNIAHFAVLGVQLVQLTVSALFGMRQAFQSGINTVLSFMAGVPNSIVQTLSSLGGLMFAAGQNFMNMLASGISSAAGQVVQQAVNVANNIKHVLGFASPPKGGPLSDSHTYMPRMMQMYAQGISDNTPLLTTAAGHAALALKSGFTSPTVQGVQAQAVLAQAQGGAGQGGVGRTSTYNLVMDSKTVSSFVVDHITGQLQMNGLNRYLR